MSGYDISELEGNGKRFAFGENWRRFLSVLDDDRIAEAERSLCEMLGVETLSGRTFLDVGSGSGLFSLAAMRLGADRVYSFDYDPQSVACTQELRRRYCPHDERWTIEQGSALDRGYLASLGTWDIVYSWGVLHHTGDMWRALGNVVPLVRDGGILFISIYNDQGQPSHYWRRIKRIYNGGERGRRLIIGIMLPYTIARSFVGDLLKRQNPLRRYRAYRQSRGMSFLHNMYDWLGGYPFEVAKPDKIFDFYRVRGFTLARLVTVNSGYGCNEFVFERR